MGNYDGLISIFFVRIYKFQVDQKHFIIRYAKVYSKTIPKQKSDQYR